MVKDSLPSHGLEAHHLTPLSSVGKEHKVSAVDDMRPLCNVCHKIVHAVPKGKPPREVEKLRTIVNEELARKRA